MLQEWEQAITIANDSKLSSLIGTATRRLIVMAPAVTLPVAKTIQSQWHALGPAAVSVILDVDAEVYRLGYGDIEALTLLEQTATDLHTTLKRHEGIRIGVVIADDTTLVYAPTPQLIEAGPHNPSTPNAVVLGSPPPAVVRELGQGSQGAREQVIGCDKAEKKSIKIVEEDLRGNPPQKFDVARSIRVFNAAFEFVDFELLGTFIDRKTVPIPKYLSGVRNKQTREQLQTSFRILPPDHTLSGAHLEHDKTLIAKRFLHTIPRYESVVLRSEKEAFKKAVNALEEGVKKFGEEVRKTLQAAMDKNRETLVRSMLPLVKRVIPQEWLKSDGSKPDAETLKRFLSDDLQQAFGTADRLIKQMQVRLVFKGVTYELLKAPEFIEAARKALPQIKDFALLDEFDAAKAVERQDAER